MKKLFIILIAAASFSAASAQGSNNRYNSQDRSQVTQRDTRNYNDQRQSNNYAYNNNNGWKNDRDHQVVNDHMNQQYDQRTYGYRNERTARHGDGDRLIKSSEYGTQERSRSIGTGAIIGGVAGLLIGVLISH
ncbi:MAG: hypothetical protein ABIY62_00165 [Ginsengibacter sp.]